MRRESLSVMLLLSLLPCAALVSVNNDLIGAESPKPCDRACLERVVEENGRKQIVMTRIKVENQEISELFKIKNRQITRIEAIAIEVPYGMPSGWSKRKY